MDEDEREQRTVRYEAEKLDDGDISKPTRNRGRNKKKSV